MSFVNAYQASQILGVNEGTVRKWIRLGKLRASKEGGVFRIDPDTLVGLALPRRRMLMSLSEAPAVVSAIQGEGIVPVTERTIRRWLKRGWLTAEKVGPAYQISSHALYQCAVEHLPASSWRQPEAPHSVAAALEDEAREMIFSTLSVLDRTAQKRVMEWANSYFGT